MYTAVRSKRVPRNKKLKLLQERDRQKRHEKKLSATPHSGFAEIYVQVASCDDNLWESMKIGGQVSEGCIDAGQRTASQELRI